MFCVEVRNCELEKKIEITVGSEKNLLTMIVH